MTGTPIVAQVQQSWLARYNGPTNGWDSAVSVAVDSSGNVYVTGASESSPANPDYVTGKYLSGGAALWSSRYNGTSNANDIPASVKVDLNGNVYVTGTSRGLTSGEDIVTVKYDAAGMQLWTTRYSSGGALNDAAAALEISPAGNVYVTGSASNNTSFVTIKYDPSGTEVWRAFYNGTNGGNSAGVSLALDTAENVHVTGYAMPYYALSYCATLKYDADGNRAWVAHYGGTEEQLSLPTSIAVDPGANVYVTGRSERRSRTGQYDYATVKYAPNGVPLWSARHTNTLGQGNAAARTVAVDGLGNVYVTGTASGISADDLVTIKYSPAGTQQWLARYNGPANRAEAAMGMVLDADGNAYVTGSSSGSGTNTELATLKYAPDGNQLWAIRTPATASTNPANRLIAVGASNEIYVCGEIAGLTASRDMALFRYDQLANPDHPAIITQPSAQSVIRGSNAMFTVSATGAPPLQFRWRFNGQTQAVATTQTLLLTDVQIAQQGDYSVQISNNSGLVESPSVRLTVNYINTQPQSQIVAHGGNAYWNVVPVGTEPFTYQWRFNDGDIPGATNSILALTNVQPLDAGWYSVNVSNIAGVMRSDAVRLSVTTRVRQTWVDARDPGHSIALDSAGNVYVTGSARWLAPDYRNSDCITCKFLPDGARAWRAIYNGPANEFDGLKTAWTFRGRMIAVDAAGQAYITASSRSFQSWSDYVTIKYDTNGVPAWIARLSGISDSSSDPIGIRLDASGNAYVAGRTGNYPSEGFMTVKYDPAGNKLWVTNRAYAGPTPTDFVLDGAGNTYVTGGRFSPTTVKYDSAGNQIRATTSFDENHWAMALDSQTNLIIVGSRYFSGSDYDYVITKYSFSGTLLWSRRHPDSGTTFDSAWDVAIGSDDAVYVAGSTATVKYSPEGVRLWASTIGGRDIKVETNGTVYLLDYVLSPVTGYDYSLRKIDADGERLWEARYGTLASDTPMALETDHNGSIYVTGSAGTLKYTEQLVPPFQLTAVINGIPHELSFRLTGEAGRFYSIQASTDLITWTTITNLVNRTGSLSFSDPAMNNFRQRFYRAALEF